MTNQERKILFLLGIWCTKHKGWAGVGGGAKDGRDGCTPRADPLCCTAETQCWSTARLQIVKKKKKRKKEKRAGLAHYPTNFGAHCPASCHITFSFPFSSPVPILPNFSSSSGHFYSMRPFPLPKSILMSPFSGPLMLSLIDSKNRYITIHSLASLIIASCLFSVHFS